MSHDNYDEWLDKVEIGYPCQQISPHTVFESQVVKILAQDPYMNHSKIDLVVSRSLSTSKKKLHSNNNRLQFLVASTTAPIYNAGMMSNLHPDYNCPSEEFLQASTNPRRHCS